jgi:hypothetical protein
VTATLDIALNDQHLAEQALRTYLTAVGAEVGIGLESVTIDHETPTSAYLALDTRLPDHPDRDTALVWDERYGWAAAVETHSGEDLLVIAYLGGESITPQPWHVKGFLEALTQGHRAGLPTPPAIRAATTMDDLYRHLIAGTADLNGRRG